VIERLRFASCYVYSPRFESVLAEQSRKLRDRIKGGDIDAIKLAADRVKQFFEAQEFGLIFGPDVTLVPIPGRAPLAPDATSRTQQIALALAARGLAAEVQPLVERIKPVQKSAFAGPGARPTPATHRESFAITSILARPRRIVLVDDVVTRGATFLGAAARLAEHLPETEIQCFALVRTISDGDIESIRAPCVGTIEYDVTRDQSFRRP
jgi:hypothetical protein